MVEEENGDGHMSNEMGRDNKYIHLVITNMLNPGAAASEAMVGASRGAF